MLMQALAVSALVLLASCVSCAAVGARAGGEARVVLSAAGAVGDGKTLNTPAIQKAIDDLAARGGGTLVVPPGKFLTGAIFLKPKVNLHLEKGATLLGSANIDDYPTMPTRIEGATNLWRPALLNAANCDGLHITGDGTIQGGGKPFWDAFLDRRRADRATKNLDVHRPRNVFIQDSKNVVVRGVALRESGFWNLHLYRCQNATIERVDIRTPAGAPSTDGIDIDSCQDVTIRACYISVDDDNIALKGTKGPLADRDEASPPVERIHIVDCTFAFGHGVVTLGSEASHVKGVLVENCKVGEAADAAADLATGAAATAAGSGATTVPAASVGATAAAPGATTAGSGATTATTAASGARRRTNLVRFKLRPDTPQHYEDIHFRNITLNNDGNLVSIEPWTQYFDLKGHPEPRQLVENVTIEGVTGRSGAFGRIRGPKNAVVRNVTMRNIDLTLRDPKATIENVDGLKIENVKINGAALAPPAAGAN